MPFNDIDYPTRTGWSPAAEHHIEQLKYQSMLAQQRCAADLKAIRDQHAFDLAVEAFDEVLFSDYRPAPYMDAEDRARERRDAELHALEAFRDTYLEWVGR